MQFYFEKIHQVLHLIHGYLVTFGKRHGISAADFPIFCRSLLLVPESQRADV